MVLGTEAKASLPSSVVHFRIKLSSLLLIFGELGISALIAIRLLEISHVPELPSLNDIAIATKASFVSEAQEVKITEEQKSKSAYFITTFPFIGNLRLGYIFPCKVNPIKLKFAANKFIYQVIVILMVEKYDALKNNTKSKKHN